MYVIYIHRLSIGETARERKAEVQEVISDVYHHEYLLCGTQFGN